MSMRLPGLHPPTRTWYFRAGPSHRLPPEDVVVTAFPASPILHPQIEDSPRNACLPWPCNSSRRGTVPYGRAKIMGEGLAGWGAQRAARTAGPPAGDRKYNIARSGRRHREFPLAGDPFAGQRLRIQTFRLGDGASVVPPMTEKACFTWRGLLSIGSLK